MDLNFVIPFVGLADVSLELLIAPLLCYLLPEKISRLGYSTSRCNLSRQVTHTYRS